METNAAEVHAQFIGGKILQQWIAKICMQKYSKMYARLATVLVQTQQGLWNNCQGLDGSLKSQSNIGVKKRQLPQEGNLLMSRVEFSNESREEEIDLYPDKNDHSLH